MKILMALVCWLLLALSPNKGYACGASGETNPHAEQDWEKFKAERKGKKGAVAPKQTPLTSPTLQKSTAMPVMKDVPDEDPFDTKHH